MVFWYSFKLSDFRLVRKMESRFTEVFLSVLWSSINNTKTPKYCNNNIILLLSNIRLMARAILNTGITGVFDMCLQLCTVHIQ